MPDRYPQLAGFVLAGGASRRMGRPKHELTFGTGVNPTTLAEAPTMLATTVRLARSVARSVAVLGPPDRAAGLESGTSGFDIPAFPDELPGLGPLSAILTGLKRTRAEFNLVLSCDLPFMSPRFLRYLAWRALESQADVTLAETPSEGYQPLAAIYRRRLRTVIRRALAEGNNKVTSFFPRVKVCLLTWPELARAGFQTIIFDNLNTPEDYDRARRRMPAVRT
ncbi:MAG TPA: molybdenum cofactor guanylyltransferase [Terriglobia bacterium]|nr:molybdenum cofactor guanylyltransferase [Terriglobia bacterium]